MAKTDSEKFIPSDRNKMLIYYVYSVLKEYSDEDHPLMHKSIVELIQNVYGMECERKAVSNNITVLRDRLGYDIQTVTGKGVYLGERTFEESEASFLVDAVFTNREISSTHANRLCKKILNGFSRYQQNRYHYIYDAKKISRGSNQQYFFSVEELSRAIMQRKKVTFDYISYNADGKKTKARKVSPYYMSNANGSYYLICAISRKVPLMHFRVDHIENVKVLDGTNGNEDEATPPIEEVKGCCRDFDFVDYANKHLYMFGGDTVCADILLRREEYLTHIYGQFGEDVIKKETPSGVVVTVRTNEQALVYWLMQYGDKMEVLSPQSTRDRVTNIVQYMASVYQ